MIFKKFLKYHEIKPGLIYPPYPPYHKGDYIEQFFIKFYKKHIDEFVSTGYEFIPVLWTDIYNHRRDLFSDLQNDLNFLDKSKRYFTVSQHDDAPMLQTLPINTLNFSAGGNAPNTIPIPLICSPIYFPSNQKDIFCSFVGSATHPIRIKMLETLVGNPDYLLKPKHWTPDVSQERTDLFLDITSRSKFTLCPRGYGSTSFRLYESMQLNSVPVYIFDKPHLPFLDFINWDDICVLVHIENLINLDKILKSISSERYISILQNIENAYTKFFTLESMCKTILKILKDKK